MKAAVITFPGSNCDRDLAVAFEQAGSEVVRVWHKDTALAGWRGRGRFARWVFLWRLPALRCDCRAFAHRHRHRGHAQAGGYVSGHLQRPFRCFLEMGLLPGALLRNAGLKFVCKPVELNVVTTDSAFTSGYSEGAQISISCGHIMTAISPQTQTLSRACKARGASLLAMHRTPTDRMATLRASCRITVACLG